MAKLSKKEKILYHLKEGKSITPRQAFFDYSAMRLSAIIFDLKEDGYDIKSERETSRDKFGDKVSYAKYTLIK